MTLKRFDDDSSTCVEQRPGGVVRYNLEQIRSRCGRTSALPKQVRAAVEAAFASVGKKTSAPPQAFLAIKLLKEGAHDCHRVAQGHAVPDAGQHVSDSSSSDSEASAAPPPPPPPIGDPRSPEQKAWDVARVQAERLLHAGFPAPDSEATLMEFAAGYAEGARSRMFLAHAYGARAAALRGDEAARQRSLDCIKRMRAPASVPRRLRAARARKRFLDAR